MSRVKVLKDANSFMVEVARWQALVSWLCLVTPTWAFLASPFVAARTHLMSAAVDNFATELELVLHPQLALHSEQVTKLNGSLPLARKSLSYIYTHILRKLDFMSGVRCKLPVFIRAAWQKMYKTILQKASKSYAVCRWQR
jgi:hypothetical protein